MAPEELKTRLEELRTLITDRGRARGVVLALDELIVQAQAMSELLQEGA